MHIDEHKRIDPATRKNELKRARELHENPDRFADYVGALRPKLMPMIAYVMRQHPNEVEDAFQECALRIYNGLPSFKGESTLDTWSYKVGIRRTLGVLKHFGHTVKNSNTVSLEDQGREGKNGKKIPFDIPSGGLSPLDIVLIHERLEDLYKAIRTLKPDFRRVFVLGEIQGFSTEEMAEALSLNPKTVRSRLSRARTQVTAFVEREEGRRELALASSGAKKADASAKNGHPGTSPQDHDGHDEPVRTSRGLPTAGRQQAVSSNITLI